MPAVRAEPYEFVFQPEQSLLSSSICSATSSIRADSARRWATMFRCCERRCRRQYACWKPRAKPAFSSSTRARAIGPTSPTCRLPRKRAAGCDRHRRSRTHGPHSRARRIRPRHHRRIEARARRTGSGQARQRRFYATDLDAILQQPQHPQLIVCGVTTEVCVNTTVREANDRGYDCLVLADCVASYFPEFQRVRWK